MFDIDSRITGYSRYHFRCYTTWKEKKIALNIRKKISVGVSTWSIDIDALDAISRYYTVYNMDIDSHIIGSISRHPLLVLYNLDIVQRICARIMCGSP